MARKITTGIVGRQILGSIVADNNSLQSIVTNANLILEPNGTGIVESTAEIRINAGKGLRLADSDSSNYIELRSPTTVSSNVTLTFPTTAGGSGQALTTNGSGTLSWASPTVSIANQTADTATYYPTLVNAATGTTSTVSVSDTRLSFQPSTGTLTATIGRITSNTASNSETTGALVVTGGIGTSGNVYASGIIRFTNNTVSTSTSTGALVVSGGVGIAGALNAISKSFDIIHPMIPGKKLRHGSLEGPEFGVYYRGRLTNSNVIELPEYWKGLVHDDTITVNFTNIGKVQNVWVEETKDNKVYIGGSDIDVYFVVYGERKDIAKLVVEE